MSLPAISFRRNSIASSKSHSALRRFFQDYKQLEGKAVEVDEIRPSAEAHPIILDALHRYSDQRRKGFNAKH
ncbi:MAG TPA: inorganic diphosphatase [Terriglobales bacterium]|nr:inorganic diphosphatase [Terriglobales bacterium]